MNFQPNTQYSGREIGGFLVQEAVESRVNTTIYRAVQMSLKRFVSFKVNPLPIDAAERDRFLRGFDEQIAQVISLEHIHLLPIYASGHIDGEAVYIVSRMLPGTLDALLRVGRLPIHNALAIARQIGSALSFLHANGFIHASISPRVLYINNEKQIYLNDLELAQVVRHAPSVEYLQELLGSLHYVSPELIRLHANDTRADVYGFGAALYDLVTGEPPFRPGTTPESMLELKEANALRPPRTFNEEVSPQLEAIILKALRADPDERYPSPQAMTQALNALGGAMPARTDAIFSLEQAMNILRRAFGGRRRQ